MKAALGQKVRISLPKAYQINKAPTKSLVVKGVPTDITVSEFKEFLDLNKISYAKAERLKSQKNCRVLPMFQLDITDPAKARITKNFTLPTRITKNSSSVLDHVLTNSADRISQFGIVNVGLLDHQLIYCTRKITRNKIERSQICQNEIFKMLQWRLVC